MCEKLAPFKKNLDFVMSQKLPIFPTVRIVKVRLDIYNMEERGGARRTLARMPEEYIKQD